MLRPPLPGRRVLRELRHQRSRRLLAVRTVREALISLAGLLDRPVRNQSGAEIGKLAAMLPCGRFSTTSRKRRSSRIPSGSAR